MQRRFCQVDVFSNMPYQGNPVAVVLDGGGLSTDEMARMTRWTSLSEATFVLPPTTPDADYRARIFTSASPTDLRSGGYELPFAGHPTLGTCHAWLETGGSPKCDDIIVQECGAGLIPVRRTPEGLAFSAPPLLRGGPVEDDLRAHIASILRVDANSIINAAWADNGPGWAAVMLPTAEAVLELKPGRIDIDLGVVGPYPKGSPCAFEVRAFFPRDGATVEDPVTGSLNASLAQWLLELGYATAPYIASQGTVLGRAGRIHVSCDADGTIWVGGAATTCIKGTIEL